MRSATNQSWTLVDDNLFEVIPESSHSVLDSSKNYLVFLQRKGLKHLASQNNPIHWPYAPELVGKATMGQCFSKSSFKDNSTMSKDISRTHSTASEVKEKWTKVFVPDERVTQELKKEKMLSILEEECSSLHTER